MTELPTDWSRASLRELHIEAQPGFACGKHHRQGGGVAHLRPMNISREGSLTLDDVKYVDDDSARRVVAGDVLFNNTNSPPLVGKTAYVSVPEPLAFSNHMTRLRVQDDVIDARFLALQLHSLWGQGYFQRICSNHVNQASVATRKLLETVITFPPLAEQRRIVAILEDHLSRLAVGEDSLRSVMVRSASLRKSLLSSAFSGSLADSSTGTL
ncbi:MAG: restriction endonuclease subunit S [Candidatus Nanopelagicales bacterium]|nr:restriction endonuclease subunit S [Candidatus Nanopelagicales bacterium]MDZ4249833.1 restriction endonuclease subunit S [Candidatus Nanopelagicales bacterium]